MGAPANRPIQLTQCCTNSDLSGLRFFVHCSSESNGGTRTVFIYFADICTFLNLTLGIRFEPVLGGLSRLKEMPLYHSIKMVRSNENNNIIYSNSMKTNRNELIRRLLSGVTEDELEHLAHGRLEIPNFPSSVQNISLVRCAHS